MQARESQRRAYHVLLILTDGDITDKQQTITAIVDAATAPVSIIIVGVSLPHCLPFARSLMGRMHAWGC